MSEKKIVVCITYPPGLKLLTRLILQLNLNENRFRHGFSDTINPMYACGTKVETFPLAFSILQYSKIRSSWKSWEI